VKVVEGDYEAYSALVQKEKEAAEKAKARAAAPPPPPPPKSAEAKPKNKKKFSYRPAAELEEEIARVEAEAAEVEDLLGQPATWRDPTNAMRVQDRHVELKQKLETLFQHWEFAVESEW
jgi:ATP-binding cassette subfamily F protein 3